MSKTTALTWRRISRTTHHSYPYAIKKADAASDWCVTQGPRYSQVVGYAKTLDKAKALAETHAATQEA